MVPVETYTNKLETSRRISVVRSTWCILRIPLSTRFAAAKVRVEIKDALDHVFKVILFMPNNSEVLTLRTCGPAWIVSVHGSPPPPECGSVVLRYSRNRPTEDEHCTLVVFGLNIGTACARRKVFANV